MSFTKSPLNYTGTKFKYLEDLFLIFSTEIDTFLDVFGGTGIVGFNSDCKKVIYNELNTEIFEIIKLFNDKKPSLLIDDIYNHINNFNLNIGKRIENTEEDIKENILAKNNYYKFRDYYNSLDKENKSLELYLLHLFSFNNLIRFNNSIPKKFNVPYGQGRKKFDDTNKEKISEFHNRLKNINVVFLNNDFRNINYKNLTNTDFVYFDPPYILSSAEYNKIWGIEEELSLYNICDKLNDNGIRFAISNMIEHNGKVHTSLKDWVLKHNYNIYYLKNKYTGWTNTKTKSYKTTKEVLITNYQNKNHLIK